MIWVKVGTHGMQSGDYRVAKNYIDGCTLYQVFFKDELLKHCNDFDECKEVANNHAKGKT